MIIDQKIGIAIRDLYGQLQGSEMGNYCVEEIEALIVQVGLLYARSLLFLWL